jgi:hypothetical protein
VLNPRLNQLDNLVDYLLASQRKINDKLFVALFYIFIIIAHSQQGFPQFNHRESHLLHQVVNLPISQVYNRPFSQVFNHQEPLRAVQLHNHGLARPAVRLYNRQDSRIDDQVHNHQGVLAVSRVFVLHVTPVEVRLRSLLVSLLHARVVNPNRIQVDNRQALQLVNLLAVHHVFQLLNQRISQGESRHQRQRAFHRLSLRFSR